MPLPLKRNADGIIIDTTPAAIRTGNSIRNVTDRELISEVNIEQGVTIASRITRWQQKLLDLSLRNRLLNFRDSKQNVPLASADPCTLEDQLAANERFTLHGANPLLAGTDVRNLAILENTNGEDPVRVFLREEFRRKRLCSFLNEDVLSRRLLELYRQSRVDIEEGGVNTLFLAVGFLEWKETSTADVSHIAPLLLIPVKLNRQSAQAGFSIERSDEDTIINVTLLELLRRDYELNIRGLDPLPTDDSGVNVPLVLQIFKQSVKDLPGWEVRSEVQLGRFSFNKFIMWSDLTSRLDLLMQNPVVKHLVNNPDSAFDNTNNINPEDIESQIDFDRLFCPLSADSSQLAAVLMSERGKSFVLHGPPGTGKSQTITNIIAHNLALGRKVLFVSEKRAALKVVHRRLCSIGLKPFCLELHSNKSGKSEVLKQFADALNFTDRPITAAWPEVTHQLNETRQKLNNYVEVLHHVYPNGLSAYNCFAYLLKHGKSLSIEDFAIGEVINHSREHYAELLKITEELSDSAKLASLETRRKLAVVEASEWSPQWEKDVAAVAQEMMKAAEFLAGCYQEMSELFAVKNIMPDDCDIYNLAVLAEAMKGSYNLTIEFTAGNYQQFAEDMTRVIKAGRERDELMGKLSDFRIDIVRSLDTAGIRRRIEENKQKFIFIRYFKNRTLLQEIKDLKKIGGTPLAIPELSERIELFDRLNAACAIIDNIKPQAEVRLRAYWNDSEADWAEIEAIIEWGKSLHNAILTLSGSKHEQLNTIKQKIGSLLPDAKELFAHDRPLREKINQLLTGWNSYQKVIGKFERILNINPAYRNGCKGVLSFSIELAQNVYSLQTELRRHCLWQKSKHNAQQAGLNSLISAVENGSILSDNIVGVFEQGYRLMMINEIVGNSEVLRNFLGSSHDSQVKKFRELDEKYVKLSSQLIVSRLAEQLPKRRQGPCPDGTELGILKRECEKRARQKPVRALLAAIPSLLPSLKPCFLMSPLSVAQYLPAGLAAFDLVVFDEASQIPVWDAIGAIARGQQVIVVGDPKQMPPSNFFQRQEDEDEITEMDSPEDLESILDECIASGLSDAHLKWHYRSRHESLIAFSNYHYYQNRLLTFPSARNSGALGVRFKFVDGGTYDKSKSRTNRLEAESIVAAVTERLKNPQLSGKSIGIVTFSQAQKDLIEDLLDDTRRRQPELEAFFTDNVDEPLFVKNLENVQGDERDVIFFSVAYGPDASGKFSMNFGPLNLQGGERRLNVAITRAKEEVIVFSSIHGHQIDLSRTRAVGATHLKYFLDYAEKGTAFIAENSHNITDDDYDSGFEDEIVAFLRESGFVAHTKVGCSGYRVDMGIVHPDSPEDYAIGIECDGAAYHRSATASDRDRLRQSVLENLGWRIHRVWSADWWHDAETTKGNLLSAIESATKQSIGESVSKIDDGPSSEFDSAKIETHHIEAEFNAEVKNSCDFESKYPCIVLPRCPSQENFYEPYNRTLIRAQMIEVINNEGPITGGLLRKRIVKAWGFTRTGDNILNIIRANVPVEMAKSKNLEDTVFWPHGINPDQYKFFRSPGSDSSSRRNIDEIPTEELKNAMHWVLLEFHSCPQDVLYREAVKKFGYSKVTSQMQQYLNAALKLLQN